MNERRKLVSDEGSDDFVLWVIRDLSCVQRQNRDGTLRRCNAEDTLVI
jgi:hypothetical protein